MKLHRPIVTTIVETIQAIFEQGVYADKAVAQVLTTNKSFGSRDRRFIAETIYEMVRWRRRISVSWDITEKQIPNHYQLFATWMVIKGIELPDWEEFAAINITAIQKNAEAVNTIRKYRESLPDWLDEIASKELGEELWDTESAALNKEALLVLRANSLKTSAFKLLTKLNKQQIGVQTIPYEIPVWKLAKKYALVAFKRQKVNHLIEFKQGLFEIQDASSQLVAPFLELQDGMTVIDACAGAGGKSLHMAALMKNTGKIIAMDVEENKLTELKKRAHRAGVNNITTQVINAQVVEQLANTADRLLLDVPCSGLGVLKRNPDTKWKMTEERLAELTVIQQNILQEYSTMLKPDGLLVYATCSILPRENEKQVQAFLKKNTSFTLLKELKVMPSDGFDGFYMAALTKKDLLPSQ